MRRVQVRPAAPVRLRVFHHVEREASVAPGVGGGVAVHEQHTASAFDVVHHPQLPLPA